MGIILRKYNHFLIPHLEKYTQKLKRNRNEIVSMASPSTWSTPLRYFKDRLMCVSTVLMDISSFSAISYW
jgi:hypothetical protein